MDRKKRILIIIPLLRSGGAEKIALLHASMFSKKYDVTVFTFHENEDYFRASNVYSLNWNYSLLAIFKSLICGPFIVRKYCKKNKINVVISHMERSNYIVALSRLFGKYRYIHFAVVHNTKYVKSLKHKYLIKFLYHRIDKIICVSKRIMQTIKSKYGIENLITIYNPIDFDKVNPLKNGEVLSAHKSVFNNADKILITVGRLHEQKGHRFLIDAFHVVQGEVSNLKLLLLGEGPLRKSLENQISRLELQEKVLLLGNVDNVFPYIINSDVFILSSLWEGFPGVLIEALSCGIPIISSDCDSGPREILSQNLPLEEDLTYPHKTDSGYIISDPAKNEENFIKDLFILLMNINSVANNTPYPSILSEISIQNIFNEWKQLLG